MSNIEMINSKPLLYKTISCSKVYKSYFTFAEFWQHLQIDRELKDTRDGQVGHKKFMW